MHRLAATPGGWNPEQEGVVFIEQNPAPLVFLTAADTDIQTLARASTRLPQDFPALRVANLLHLQQPLTIDTYAETVLDHAQVIILRLLGGRAYWSYGLEVVQETVQRNGSHLIVLPGDDRPDPDLLSHSTVPLTIANQIWRYCTEGGSENLTHALQCITDACLGTAYNPLPPSVVPQVGIYRWRGGEGERGREGEGERGRKGEGERKTQFPSPIPHPPSPIPHPPTPSKVGILFYRAHYLSGNTAAIDALCEALAERGLEPLPVFVSSLRDPEVQAEVLDYFQPKEQPEVAVVLNTTSFAIADLTEKGAKAEGKVKGKRQKAEGGGLETSLTELPAPRSPFSVPPPPSPLLWHSLNLPVLQVILSGGTLEQWQGQWRGLSPRDIAMNVALPEVDGRIITRAVSFKAVQSRSDRLETDVVQYEPLDDRIQFVADLATNWVRLRQTAPADRRIALILANYPTRDGRLANGVGLDTPASCVAILQAMQQAGYQIDHPPQTSDELLQRLTATITNDPEGRELRPVLQSLDRETYQHYFATLPETVQKSVCDRWGEAEEKAEGLGAKDGERRTEFHPPSPLPPLPLSPSPPPPIPIPGIQLGNVFVGIQPARGYDKDPSLNYHAPDLEPTHEYLAFYYWLRQEFGAQAIVHIGKHGNLEWLPGKGIALSESCYPEVALGALPHLYPFIVNDPGEGAQAKRRAQAVILDHLTPPMTRAELYGALHQLERLVDEYYEAQNLDPSRLNAIRDRILALVQQENLDQELKRQKAEEKAEGRRQKAEGKAKERAEGRGWNEEVGTFEGGLLPFLDRYLCELKEAQIRDGLHIFGKCPEGRQLRDLIVAIARHPGAGRLGLTRAIAQDWGLDFDPLTVDPAAAVEAKQGTGGEKTPWRNAGEAIAAIEDHAATLIDSLLPDSPSLPTTPIPIPHPPIPHPPSPIPTLTHELHWITTHLLPALHQTSQEISNLLRGLNGEYVPAGASGAPTRGRSDVLPTGRNFYSVDLRSIPTETAWDVGRKAAEAFIERYTQEQGEYPKTLGLSIWGTSTMRTGGDDLAEALALLGVQPVWEGVSRRVIDFEILPLSLLDRPRVDVTLRISGFFRDAFANLIDLFDQAVQAVAALEEPEEQNPLAARVSQETEQWQAAGLTTTQAQARSRYRIFGSKPGAYGAGLQGLLEAQNWTDDTDLARAYLNWSSYAYTRQGNGCSAPEAFAQRLQEMQVVLHNQDNREHDLLDSDDYYQFQGGLTAAVRSLRGENPHTYFGDHSLPEKPRVRRLQEEIARVYRSRVVNPKWIAGVMRHGYKGAFELAATVDYLFAYDATAHCVEDFMYQGITEAYVLNPQVQAFVQQKNPWALRDMAERLLEAHQRQLWQTASPEIVEQLRAIVHEAEGAIESTTAQ
jgi:cobaltochelatase CobN